MARCAALRSGYRGQRGADRRLLGEMPHGFWEVWYSADAVVSPNATICSRIESPRGGAMSTAPEVVDERVAPADVLWVPEPGACGGRIDPEQELVPGWLAERVDWHLRPSASPWATARMARTCCAHVDWTMVWATDPTLFARRAQLGIPSPPDLWQARTMLAELGYELLLEVQLENLDGALGLAIYGAGVTGTLTPRAWRQVAPLLTTCCCTIHEPRAGPMPDPLAPARPVTAGGQQHPSGSVTPMGWCIGDWWHTWWSYPMAGPLRPGCRCPAHRTLAQFGPDGLVPADAG